MPGGNEIIGIGVQVNTAPIGELKKELKEAEENARKVSQEFGVTSAEAETAAQRVQQLSTTIKEVETPVKSLRAQLREALADVDAMREQFGATSEQAIAAARRAGELQDRIGDARAQAQAFNPDAKFAAFAQSLQGVVGGFTALQGAMALFGVESKNVQETLLKVQGALALSQGLNSVIEAKDSFMNLAAVIKSTTAYQVVYNATTSATAFIMRTLGISVDTTAASFKVLRGAIAATGIGVLVVLVGVLISKFSDASDKIEDTTEKLSAFQQKIKDYAAYSQKAGTDSINQAESIAVAKAKAEDKSAAEIYNIQKDASEKRIKLLQDEANKLIANGINASDKLADIEKARTDIKVKEYEAQKDARVKAEQEQKKADELAKQAAEKKKQEQKKIDEDYKKALQDSQSENLAIQQDAETKELQELSAKYGERIAAFNKAGKDTAVLVETWEQAQQEIRDKYAKERAEKQQQDFEKQSAVVSKAYSDSSEAVVENAKLDFDTKRDILDGQRQQILADAQLTEDERTRILKENSDARKEIDQKEAESRKAAIGSVANDLNSFAELAGKQTAVGKALAIASTTISTYQAAQEAFSSLAGIPIVGPALGAIAAAAAVASGIARIKQIVAVQVPGGGSGGGSTPSIGSGTSSPPLSPQTTVQTTSLDQKTINQIGNSAVRAYVVESDISNSQDRIRRITNAAKID